MLVCTTGLAKILRYGNSIIAIDGLDSNGEFCVP